MSASSAPASQQGFTSGQVAAMALRLLRYVA
jgi:hypothetical protein